MGGSTDRIRALLRHLVPSTMGARLVLTAAVIAITTTIVTLSINAALVEVQSQAWTRSDVTRGIEGFRSFLILEGRGIADDVAYLKNTPVFRELFESGDAATLQRQYGMRMLDAARANATVGVDAAGRILFSSGTAANVAHLQALATSHGPAETTGITRMEGGLAVVSGAPVLKPDDSGRVGYVIVARLVDSSRLLQFEAVSHSVTARLEAAGYRPAGIALSSDPEKGPSVLFGATGDAVVTVADLRSMEGGLAGTVELRDRDVRVASASSVALTSSVLASLAAGLIGLGLGLWMAGVMRRPIGRMIANVRRRAQLAANGTPAPGSSFTPEIGLPREFEELAAVIDELVRHLDAHRAELQLAVREAEFAEETLSVVVNESNEVKLVVQDDVVVIANPAAAEALGVPVNELLGSSPTRALARIDIRTADDAPISGPELIDLALDERTTVAFSQPDGRQRWYAVDAIRRTDHSHDRLLLTARDVTEERRIASIRAEIISLVGHDLRSPLTVVIGYLDLLQRPMTDVERARALDAARRNAARMADLLEDLLSATRAEELLAPSDLVPTSLTALAEEVVSSLAPTHSERRLLLEQDCDPIVLGEEKRLRQVLVNLVTNAYKYSPDPDPIVVRVSCDDKTAYLEVIDHGPGIPADEREHVFERFARLPGGETRNGVGLGLYIVQIIAHNHGGTVRVDETPGGGATFVVELPLVGTMVDGEFVL